MKEIILKGGQIALVSDIDYEMVSKHKWSILNGYAVICGTVTSMHRIIMGDSPMGIVIDHANRNKLDNRRENLRPCTYSQNSANVGKRDNTYSIFKGVTAYGNKFRASITVRWEAIPLGIYDSEQQAAKAYNIAAKYYFKEFSVLNDASILRDRPQLAKLNCNIIKRGARPISEKRIMEGWRKAMKVRKSRNVK